jgi:tetratricopeptide (TPR) repeat protein
MRHGNVITPTNQRIIGRCLNLLLENPTTRTTKNIDLAFARAIVDQKPARGHLHRVYNYFISLRYFAHLDYDNAITYQSKAIEMLPENSGFSAVYLGILGRFLLIRFENLRALDDLKRSLDCYLRAEALARSEDLRDLRLACLNVSNNCRFRLCDYLDSWSDLDTIIASQRTVVRDASLTDYLSEFLESLALFLMRRSERLSALKDVEECMALYLEASKRTSAEGRPIFASISHLNLAILHFRRFTTLEDKVDLDTAISLSEEYLQSICQGRPLKPNHLCNVGYYYTIRSELRDDVDDLDVGEERLQRALSIVDEDNTLHSMIIKHLAISHAARFRHSRRIEYISEAILRMQQRLIHMTPAHPNDLSVHYNILGIFLRIRHDHVPRLQDLDEAITYQTQAINGSLILPAEYLRDELSLTYFHRFQFSHEDGDLDAAIQNQTAAIELAPENFKDMAIYREVLQCYMDRADKDNLISRISGTFNILASPLAIKNLYGMFSSKLRETV